MNPWTALLIGLVLGWLIEFAIDWFYWRRKTSGEKEIEELQAQLQAAEDRAAALETELAATRGDDESWATETDLETDGAEAEVVAAAAVAAAVVEGDEDDILDEESDLAADDLDEGIIVADPEGMEDEAELDFMDDEVETDSETIGGAADDDDLGTVEEAVGSESMDEGADEDYFASVEEETEAVADSEESEEIEEVAQDAEAYEAAVVEDVELPEDVAAIEDEGSADDFDAEGESEPIDTAPDVDEEAPDMDDSAEDIQADAEVSAENIENEAPTTDADSSDTSVDEAGEGGPDK
jgi:hypothetical protein